MADKTPLSDPKNVEMILVEEEPEGMSVEDAYRLLADMPPEPVLEAEE